MRYLKLAWLLPSRMLWHVRIHGGARLTNGAWDMMVAAAWCIRVQWVLIAGLFGLLML